MPVAVFHIDAFTGGLRGKSCGHLPSRRVPDDSLLRALAAENNLSETAYFVAEGDHFRLRWRSAAFRNQFVFGCTIS